MTQRYWPDREINKALPPQTNDRRGRAFARVFDGHFADNPISGFAVKDPATCPAEALPALIAEYSMEEFIAPGLPEVYVREILKNRWLLKKYKGYDKGVKLGLALLGVEAEIIHWHQRTPKGPANTQTVRFSPSAPIYSSETTLLGERTLQAAQQMIEATKRLSQGTILEVSSRVKVGAYAGATSTFFLHAKNIVGLPPPPIAEVVARFGVISFGTIKAPPVRCERIFA